MKERLTTTTILTIPNPQGDFLVCMDASLEYLGGMLSQNEKPIAFESRKLRTKELNYITHDLELVAIFDALNMWRYYILGMPFKIETNHKILKYLFTQLALNTRKRWWMEFLAEYDFGIKYIKGKENKVVDSLSCRWHVLHK